MRRPRSTRSARWAAECARRSAAPSAAACSSRVRRPARTAEAVPGVARAVPAQRLGVPTAGAQGGRPRWRAAAASTRCAAAARGPATRAAASRASTAAAGQPAAVSVPTRPRGTATSASPRAMRARIAVRCAAAAHCGRRWRVNSRRARSASSAAAVQSPARVAAWASSRRAGGTMLPRRSVSYAAIARDASARASATTPVDSSSSARSW
ncbi:hypothetical protein ACFQV2_10580 [Actinokineospora soli]|uniref:Uncharacterized protein n=1 Tax=Actinokineospora soli TaxID=1048753 RepID=A0ABW2TL04_9PSEU